MGNARPGYRPRGNRAAGRKLTGARMRYRFVAAFACAVLGWLATAGGQAPAGYDLTLIDVDGTQKVLGRLPASVYAPRLSPDGARVAFETRDPKGPDGGRL